MVFNAAGAAMDIATYPSPPRCRWK